MSRVFKAEIRVRNTAQAIKYIKEPIEALLKDLQLELNKYKQNYNKLLEDYNNLKNPYSFLQITDLESIFIYILNSTHFKCKDYKCNRKGENVLARKCFYYTCHTLYGEDVTLKQLGRVVGLNDHTTILNGISSFRNLLIVDADIRIKFNKLWEELNKNINNG